MVCCADAQTARLSGATKMLIARHKGNSGTMQGAKSVGSKSEQRIFTTILLHEKSEVADEAFDSLGIKVEKRRGRVVFAYVPVNSFMSLAEIKGIKLIDTGRKVKQYNDLAREATSVVFVHDKDVEQLSYDNVDIPLKYRGNGVLVGVIDSEIDLGHPAFRDADGKSRLVEALVPEKDATDEDEADDDEINMIIYDGDDIDEAIDYMKDVPASHSHGTHVTGIAVGSTVLIADDDPMKKYYGIAPESDILTYDLPTLSDDEILFAISCAFDKADELHRPVAVNISLGENIAPLDGTDYFNECLLAMLEDYEMSGKVICASAGNEADKNVSVQIDCNAPIEKDNWTLQKKVACVAQTDSDDKGKTIYIGDEYLTFYGADEREYAVKYEFYETSTNKKIASTPIFSFDEIQGLPEDGCWTKKGMSTSGNAYDIKLYVYDEVSSANRFYHEGYIDASFGASTYVVASIYTKSEGMKIDGAVFNGSFKKMSGSEYAVSNGDGSINALAATDYVISVGAYNTRMSYTDTNGKSHSFGSASELNKISYFSSYSTSHYGVPRPDVIAPGCQILSTYHHNIESKPIVGKMSYLATDYLWGAMSGTSMSSPVVAGIVALWLQADPSLTVYDIREVIAHTSDYDSYCEADSNRAGKGKINALRGLEYILSHTGINSISMSRNDKPVKYLSREGRLIIEKNGHRYDASGIHLSPYSHHQ